MEIQKQIRFNGNDLVKSLYGSQNTHLKRLEALAGVKINARGNEAVITGAKENVDWTYQVLDELYHILEKGFSIQLADIDKALEATKQGRGYRSLFDEVILNNGSSRAVVPKSSGQQSYLQAIRNHDIVFGIGPAGTGKTYLAIAMAVEAFNQKSVKRIVLTRPAVEAGEKLGFLPGDLNQKVDPYLRPLFDALYDMMEAEKVNRLVERGEIEIAPLAFMRGRTLNHAFIILDEAQNTTTEQMKMFLTRLGFHAKAVITGDVTQVDLPIGKKSGLLDAREILSGVSGISFCEFDERDVVRHGLVREIIKAYGNRKV